MGCTRCKGYFLDLSEMSEEQREATLNAMFKDPKPQAGMDDIPDDCEASADGNKANDSKSGE